VISTARLPGLELRLPPNTVVRDREGKVVTRPRVEVAGWIKLTWPAPPP
jgi:hypothetical protein